MALDNGKIVVSGVARISNNFTVGSWDMYVYVAQFNSDGTVDKTFGPSGDGIIRLGINLFLEAYDLKVDASDNIYCLGNQWINPDGSAFLAKLNPSGILDNSFGTNGVSIIDIGSRDNLNSMDLRADGKIVLGGYQTVYGDSCTVVLLENDGNLSADMPGGHSIITLPGEKGFIRK